MSPLKPVALKKTKNNPVSLIVVTWIENGGPAIASSDGPVTGE